MYILYIRPIGRHIKLLFFFAGNETLLNYDDETWACLLEHYKTKECVVNGENFPT